MGASAIFTSIANALTGGVVDKALDMVDKLIPDKTKANELKMQLETLRVTQDHELEMAENQLAQAQIEVNKAEATNPSIFVSGWRPFIGWVCGTGIAYAFIIHPMALFAASFTTVDLSRMPSLDVGTLMSLVLSMLGIAGLRTVEKTQGVAAVNLKG